MAISVGSVSADVVPDVSQLRKRIDAAVRNLTATIQVDADVKSAQTKINEAIRNKSVDIAVTANTATAASKVAEVAQDRSANVQVDADTATAGAKIAEVARDRRANVAVAVNSSSLNLTSSRIGNIVAAILLLGPALIPIAAVATAAFGAISFGALAAGAGIGALVLGLSGIGGALKAMGDAQKNAAGDAAKAASSQAASAAQIASAQSGLAGAEAGLRNARASAAEGAVSAAARVADAQRGLQSAERDAADAAVTAAQRVTAARQGVADATRSAAQGVQAALAQLEGSERTLTATQTASLAAQEALTQAREDAKQALEDLNNQVTAGLLAERAANLALEQAKKNLDALSPSASGAEAAMSALVIAQDRYAKALTDPKVTASQKDAAQAALDSAQAQVDGLKATSGASDLQRRQSQLSFDQAQQNLKEIQLRNARLAAEKADADKKGVAGSDQVAAAQGRIVAANQATADAQRGVADSEARVTEARRSGVEAVGKAQQTLAQAQAAQVKAQEDGAARVADAQRGVTSAMQAQASQQRQSSASIASAQRGVADAQRGLTQALKMTGDSGSASANKLKAALAGLSPAGVQFTRFLFSLRPVLKQLRDTAQGGLLLGLTDGIKAVLPMMPTFNKIIGSAAGALGDLFASAGQALGSPLFKRFFDYIAKTAGPNIKIFGGVIGDIVQGFAGLALAFAPLTSSVIKGIGDLAKKFADFGAGAGKGGAFQEFLGYVRDSLPTVKKLFADLFPAIFKILEVFAPLGSVILDVVTAIVSFIANTPPAVLAGIAAGIGAIGLAIAIAMNANPIGLIITAIALLAVGLAYAWKHSETFRKIVTGVFHVVRTVALAVFHAVTTAVVAVADFLVRTWRRIKFDVQTSWRILQALFRNSLEAIKQVWDSAWGWVRDTLTRVWRRIRFEVETAFRLVNAGVRNALDAVRGKFRDAVDAIGHIWDGLRNLAKAPIRFIVNTVLNKGLIGAFNWIVDKLKLPGMLKVDPIRLPEGFAGGGWTGPGARMAPAGIVHADEFVVRKESRRRIEQTAPGLLDYLNETGRLPGYDLGGLVGSLRGKVTSFLGGLGDIASMIAHPGEALKKILDLAFSKAGNLFDGPAGEIVKAVPAKLLGGIGDLLKTFASSVSSAFGSIDSPTAGGAGVQRWSSLISRAMVRTGMPTGTHDNWMRQIASESGGNPNAVQGNIGDVNNRSGDLAKGLLQVIGATFAAYRDPVLANNRFDPFANAVAAMRYALSRYGYNSIEGVIGHGHGYAAGTASAQPGYAWVGERGPELVQFRGGERVYSSRDSGGLPAGGSSGLSLTVTGGVHGHSVTEVAAELDRMYRQRELLAFPGGR